MTNNRSFIVGFATCALLGLGCYGLLSSRGTKQAVNADDSMSRSKKQLADAESEVENNWQMTPDASSLYQEGALAGQWSATKSILNCDPAKSECVEVDFIIANRSLKASWLVSYDKDTTNLSEIRPLGLATERLFQPASASADVHQAGNKPSEPTQPNQADDGGRSKAVDIIRSHYAIKSDQGTPWDGKPLPDTGKWSEVETYYVNMHPPAACESEEFGCKGVVYEVDAGGEPTRCSWLVVSSRFENTQQVYPDQAADYFFHRVR